MALIEGPKQCKWGHADCDGHSVTPMLSNLPSADPPKAGRCWCGEIGYLWQVPLDGKHYCKRCIRRVMRLATWPRSIRFPDER